MIVGPNGTRPLPAGPRTALIATARYLRDPVATLLDTADRYGDPFTWPTFLGRVVVTGDPVGIQEILTADPVVYSALGAELLGPVLGTNNLILLSGEPHRAMRRFLRSAIPRGATERLWRGHRPDRRRALGTLASRPAVRRRRHHAGDFARGDSRGPEPVKQNETTRLGI